MMQTDTILMQLGPLTLTVGSIIVIGLLLLAGMLWNIAARQQADDKPLNLRRIRSYDLLHHQIGKAVESGSQLHISLGRASLVSSQSQSSIASLAVLDILAEESCANDTPPIVTVGEGTLLPAAQDSLYRGYAAADRINDFSPRATQFIAPETHPMVFAAGVADVIGNAGVSSTVLVGHYGQELALMAEASAREKTQQIIGTDDPVALAIGYAATDHLLMGEELLAATAYIEGQPNQLAALRAQDILRYLVAGGLLAVALYRFLLTLL